MFSKSSQSKIAKTKFDELETELVENLSSIQPLAQLSMNLRYSYIKVSVLWLLVIKSIQRENLPLSLNLYFLWFCFLSLSDCLFWKFSFCLESNWGIWLSHCQMLLLHILRFIFFLKIYFMCCYFNCIYVCTTFVGSVRGSQKRMSGPWKVELQIIVSPHTGSRIWTSILWRNSQCSFH